MVNQKNKMSKISRYIVVALSGSFVIGLISTVVIINFPIQTKVTNDESDSYSSSFSPWPESSLEEEMQEKKRSARYRKSGHKNANKNQKTDFLSTSIYDMAFDKSMELHSLSSTPFPTRTSFLWPTLPTQYIQNNPNDITKNRPSSFVFFPNRKDNRIYNGYFLESGERIKINIPYAKGKRHFNFSIFPLTPVNIRIHLGEHVWARTFNQDEVQKKVPIRIPIYNSKANQIKVMSITASFYLIGPTVTQTSKIVKDPVKVSSSSKLWNPNDNVMKQQSSEDFASLNEYPQMVVDASTTTAIGYNIVVVQMDGFPSSLLTSPRVAKESPNIYALMRDSVLLNSSITASADSGVNFRNTIFENNNLTKDNIAALMKRIKNNEDLNSYYQFRKYGYKVVSMSYPNALFFPEIQSEDNSFQKINSKWLDSNDQKYEIKNSKINNMYTQNTGLDDFFKIQPKSVQSPLTQSDYSKISSYLTKISPYVNSIPDWWANEYILLDPTVHYIPHLLEDFQKWTVENQQSRFFAHILLSSPEIKKTSTIVDFKNILVANGLKLFFNPSDIKKRAYYSYLDRSLGHLLDTIQARKMKNRTIVLVLLKGDDEKSYTGIYKIPDLIPKKEVKISDVNMGDILNTLYANVGIPISRASLENPDFQGQTAPKSPADFVKFSMLISPHQLNCSPFIWKVDEGGFFGLYSKEPIYQVLDPNTIEFYPCSIQKKSIVVQWYQNKNKNYVKNQANEITGFLGGQFVYDKTVDELPDFYFGRNLIPFKSPFFFFNKDNVNRLHEAFYVKSEDVNSMLNNAYRSFEAFDKLKGNKSMLGKTKIALFVSSM